MMVAPVLLQLLRPARWWQGYNSDQTPCYLPPVTVSGPLLQVTFCRSSSVVMADRCRRFLYLHSRFVALSS